MQRFAENVGAPDLRRIFLKFFQQVQHKIFGLLLRADDGRNFRADACAHHMDGRCGRFQANAELAVLLDDLRLLERQLLHIGHDDAVTRLHHVVVGALQLCEFLFDLVHLDELCEQGGFVCDLHAGLFAENFEKQRRHGGKLQHARAAAEIHARAADGFEVLACGKTTRDLLHLADSMDIACAFQGIENLFFEPVVIVKVDDPAGNVESNFPHGELI